MENGGISQDELDKLLNSRTGLENLPNYHPKEAPVWIIKDLTNRAVYGGRCWSYMEAQNLLNSAMKSYPDNSFEIRQVR